MSVHEPAPASLSVLRDLPVVMPDGVTLRVNVVRPASAGPGVGDALVPDTVDLDRTRMGQMNAAIEGRPARRLAGPGSAAQRAMMVAMLYDPDIFHAFAEMIGMPALPQEVLAQPGLAERITEITADREARTPPGPSRPEVLKSLE